MSGRRWIGVVGLLVAVAGGTAAISRAGRETEFEAQVAVRLQRSEPTRLPFRPDDGPEGFLDSPEVRELVRMRLGATPPLWVKPVTDDTVLVRSRGATRQQAVEATTTYAASYLDVRRRQSEGQIAAAAATIEGKIDEIQKKVDSATGSQRASLVELLGVFTGQLDRLHVDAAVGQGPAIVGSGPAEPVDAGTRSALVVTALGAAVGIGAARSARRAGAER